MQVCRTAFAPLPSASPRGERQQSEASESSAAAEGGTRLGIAVDMGTTLVCAGVIDLDNGKEIAFSSQLNEQVAFGDNIISRINFARCENEGLKKLNHALIVTINKVIKEALQSIGRKEKEVLGLVAVGNAAMHHFLLSIMPTTLITPPYQPASREAVKIKAKNLGISLDQDTPVRVLPNLGGFVGSDCLGMILAGRISHSGKIKLAIDLGTNGNIVLGSKERILVTSTAAGGAFEGWHISCGIRAKEGAIERVWLEGGKARWEIIGRVREAEGICGSGLIDAVAEMLKAGIIDQKGNMKNKGFILYQDDRRTIKITPQDIREVQKALASIRAGIKILQKELGIDAADISEILLCGAFGNRIRKESLAGIGLIPEIDENKIGFIGNGALQGAEMVLGSEEEYSRALAITEKVEHIPLAERDDFMGEFTRAMRF